MLAADVWTLNGVAVIVSRGSALWSRAACRACGGRNAEDFEAEPYASNRPTPAPSAEAPPPAPVHTWNWLDVAAVATSFAVLNSQAFATCNSNSLQQLKPAS